MIVEENVDLKKMSSIGVGGVAKKIIYPENLRELKSAICVSKKCKITQKVLGNCSNILFLDKIYDEELVCTKKLNKLKLVKNNVIYVESGVMLSQVCKFALDNSLTGFEWSVGIPGSVGGAICGNAGCFGKDISQFVKYVEVLDKNGKLKKYTKEMCGFEYRNSIFKQNHLVIVGAYLLLEKGEKVAIESLMKTNLEKRKNQPKQLSCGSVFKNPEKYSAGYLIEQCGIKGLSLGDAQISLVHANFIVNNGEAKSFEVLKLIEIAKILVYNKFNINLECEVEVLN